MSRNIALDRDVWQRATRLLAAILLMGGIVAGPAAHLAMEAGVATSSCDSTHPSHPSDVPPDAHHDCPVCITLATAAPSLTSAQPRLHVAELGALPALGSEPGDDGVVHLSRARAPPLT
jgi:hypothetical protein